MKIAVLIKQVPSSDARIKVGADGKSVEMGDVELIVNPYDEYAMEAALQAKEKFGGEIVVVGMGGSKVEEALRHCLALGADKAMVLRDSAFDGSDSLGSARILAKALSNVEPDLVFCGKLSIDQENSAVGVMVAELMGFPHASVVSELEFVSESQAKLKREIEGGMEELEVDFPAVLTANKGLNEPRYPALKGIMMAKKKPMEVLDAAGLGLDASTVGAAGSQLNVISMEPPAERADGQLHEGEANELVAKLVQYLKDDVKVL